MEARPTTAPPGSPPVERVKELLGVVVHFFTKTRWERTFFVVDSKYHFSPERTDETTGLYGNE